MTRATAHMERKRRNEKKGLMTCPWVFLFVFPFLFSSWSKSVGAQQAGYQVEEDRIPAFRVLQALGTTDPLTSPEQGRLTKY